jgi:HEAT repeat protein
MMNETAVEVAALSDSVIAMKKFRKPMVEYLVSGLEDNDRWVRILAADLLGSIGDQGAAGHLKPLLTDQDRDLRTIAVKSLAQINSPKVPFTRTQTDYCENCMIRLIANEALEKLMTEKKDARLP